MSKNMPRYTSVMISDADTQEFCKWMLFPKKRPHLLDSDIDLTSISF